MRVAILGRTKILYDVIDAVEKAGHEVVLIGTCKASPEYSVSEKDFEEEAIKRKIPFWCGADINSAEKRAMIEGARPDIGVSMNWLTMIGRECIDSFANGILNIHPGDLPRYRGNACPNWALLNGERRVAVSVHYMDPDDLDAGDIVEKGYIEIEEDTTIGNIYDSLEKLVPNLVVRALNSIEKGVLISEKQKGRALRCFPRKPCDSLIDWTADYLTISRLVRASGTPFSGAYTYIGGKKLYVYEVSCIKTDCDYCGVPGQIVSIDKLNDKISVLAGDGIVCLENARFEENDERITDYIRSTRMRAGYSVEDELFNINYRLAKLEEKLGL